MYSYLHPHPAVTVDNVVFRVEGECLMVLLIQRRFEPFKDMWAFPGGFLEMNETAEEGAARELKEETGLSGVTLHQFHTFSAVNRDPRERIITIAYFGVTREVEVQGQDDAAQARWWPVNALPPLAADHAEILRAAMQAFRERVHFEPIVFEMLPEVFSMTQLQNAYEAVLQHDFGSRGFYNQMQRWGILVEEPRPPKQRMVRYRFSRELYDEKRAKGFWPKVLLVASY